MNEIKTIVTCPLGSKCKEVKDGAIYRCAWLMDVQGTNLQTGEPENQSECAIVWSPLMQIKQLQGLHGVQVATESFRNEMVKGQEESYKLLAHSVQQTLLPSSH